MTHAEAGNPAENATGAGFACSGSLSEQEIAATAMRAEELGYTSLWITVLRDVTDPAAVLEAALGSSTRIEVGLGVVPLDAFRASELGAALANIPRRAIVGLGVGLHHRGAAEFWRNGAEQFRALAPQVRIAVGAYGRGVLHVGGEVADSVLLNWMTRERVRWAQAHLDAGARSAKRPTAPRPIFVYVPSAAGPAAARQIRETRDALRRHQYHRRHQDALEDVDSVGVSITSDGGRALLPSYGYDAVSIVFPIGDASRSQREALLEAFAPATRQTTP